MSDVEPMKGPCLDAARRASIKVHSELADAFAGNGHRGERVLGLHPESFCKDRGSRRQLRSDLKHLLKILGYNFAAYCQEYPKWRRVRTGRGTFGFHWSLAL